MEKTNEILSPRFSALAEDPVPLELFLFIIIWNLKRPIEKIKLILQDQRLMIDYLYTNLY